MYTIESKVNHFRHNLTTAFAVVNGALMEIEPYREVHNIKNEVSLFYWKNGNDIIELDNSVKFYESLEDFRTGETFSPFSESEIKYMVNWSEFVGISGDCYEVVDNKIIKHNVYEDGCIIEYYFANGYVNIIGWDNSNEMKFKSFDIANKFVTIEVKDINGNVTRYGGNCTKHLLNDAQREIVSQIEHLMNQANKMGVSFVYDLQGYDLYAYNGVFKEMDKYNDDEEPENALPLCLPFRMDTPVHFTNTDAFSIVAD